MARNEEKAMSMLARWLRVQTGEEERKNERRPHLASLCDTLQECEKWRLQIVREITKKVGEIQNPGLGEFKIRDLNDEINKLIREKSHWERRSRELGGPGFSVGIVKDADGNDVPSSGGYRYFGAAKDLPGVRELFRKEDVPIAKRSRSEMYKCADAFYFGYRDEDDAILAPLEAAAESDAQAAAVLEFHERQQMAGTCSAAAADSDDGAEEEEEEPAERFVAHVPVPSTEAVEKAVLEQKKRDLLAKYGAIDSDEEGPHGDDENAAAGRKRPRE